LDNEANSATICERMHNAKAEKMIAAAPKACAAKHWRSGHSSGSKNLTPSHTNPPIRQEQITAASIAITSFLNKIYNITNDK